MDFLFICVLVGFVLVVDFITFVNLIKKIPIMDILPFFVIISLVIIVVLAFYFQKYFRSNELENVSEPLQEFSANVKFDPFPQIVNVENPYACTGSDLRKCIVNDLTSCIGCQSLIASCIHFENDIDFIDVNGETSKIPANASENEGYCLTVSSVEDSCNLYHGDLALVQLSPDNSDSMIICNCRNPGLIGNTAVNGACDTVFICNGKIDELNRPMEQINCVCESNSFNVRLNDIPNCQLKTVLAADQENILNELLVEPDQNTLLMNDRTNFNLAIVQNVGSRYLLNPCRNCPITNNLIPNSSLGKVGNRSDSLFCSINFDLRNGLGEYFGIPIRRSKTERILAGNSGPDAILGIFWEELIIYTRLESYIQRFVFIFNSVYNEKIYEELNLDPSLKYAIAVDDMLLGVHFAIPTVASNEFPQAECIGHWPSYSCEWRQIGTAQRSESLPINIVPLTPNSNIIHGRAPRQIPGSFIWNRDDWTNMEKFNLYFEWRHIEVDGEPVRYVTNERTYFTNYFADKIKFMTYGFKLSNGFWKLQFYTNGNGDDWNRLKNAIIEYN